MTLLDLKLLLKPWNSTPETCKIFKYQNPIKISILETFWTMSTFPIDGLSMFMAEVSWKCEKKTFRQVFSGKLTYIELWNSSLFMNLHFNSRSIRLTVKFHSQYTHNSHANSNAISWKSQKATTVSLIGFPFHWDENLADDSVRYINWLYNDWWNICSCR